MNIRSILFNIQRVRIIRGITQIEMAKKLDICEKQYRNLESGKSELTLRRLIEISTILQISLTRLLTEDLSADIFGGGGALR
jgi:transcriptional regulator with XRE-family HTH domain